MEEHYDDITALKFQHYRNSTEIIPGMTMEDVMKACLIGRLNVMLVGETGEGKTQLENDVLGLFGNHGFFEQGRNDLTVKEMFTRFNLEKLRTAQSTEDIKEVTAHVSHPVYVIDELTRCIPAVQNQFFNFFDGFITVDGVKYSIGFNGYSVGIASGNVGNGRYVGTSETDRALRDRIHVIIDVDEFPKSAADTLDVLVRKKDPRVSAAEEPHDHTERIIKMHEKFVEGKPTNLQYAAALYLAHGLDYVDGIPGNSKRKNKQSWPGCVTGHATGSDAAVIFPFSTRAVISTLTLARGLEAVRAAKGISYENSLDPVFDAAYLIGAQSGVLHPAAVDSQYNGNAYSAMTAVVTGIRGEFAAKEDVLKQAIAAAQSGKLVHQAEFTGRWGYMKDILQQ